MRTVPFFRQNRIEIAFSFDSYAAVGEMQVKQSDKRKTDAAQNLCIGLFFIPLSSVVQTMDSRRFSHNNVQNHSQIPHDPHRTAPAGARHRRHR